MGTVNFQVCIACQGTTFSWDLVPDPSGPLGFGTPQSLVPDSNGGFNGVLTVHNNRTNAWLSVNATSAQPPTPYLQGDPLNALWAQLGIIPGGDDASYAVHMSNVYGGASFTATESGRASVAFAIAKLVDLALAAPADKQVDKYLDAIKGLASVMGAIQDSNTYRHLLADLQQGKIIEVVNDLGGLITAEKDEIYTQIAKPFAAALGITLSKDSWAKALRVLSVALLAFDVVKADYDVYIDLFGNGAHAGDVIFGNVQIDS
jgi:hypothetical protein